VLDDIAKATAAGIPVIAWDGPVPNSQVLGYIGTDNVAAGEQAGEALAKAVGQKGKVAVIIGSLSAVNLKQRLDGVQKALAKYPNMKLVATQVSNESIATAQSSAETILQANPDLAGFVGIGGSDLPGIAGALKSGNKCGTVKSVGFDVVPQGIDGMKGGCVDALISQKPSGMTAQALQILVDFHNKTSKLPKNFNVDTGVVTVTPDTLTEFLKTAH
jgi:ABC-type sugar transport system substrate-binding protein